MQVKNYPWKIFVICWLTGMSAGLDANLFTVLLTPIFSSLVQTTDKVLLGQLGSYALSSFLIGWALGGIFIGSASDRFGDKRTMAFALFLFTFFTAVCAYVQTPLQIAASRFMVGLGVGGAMVNMSVLLSESWPSQTRAIAVGSLLTSYQAGVFASGILVHLIADWRLTFAIGAFPIILTAFILFGIKERERQTALNMDLAGRSDTQKLVIGCLLFGSLLVAYWASASWIPTWIQDMVGASSGNEKSTATIWHGIAAVGGCFLAGPLVTGLGSIRTIILAFVLAFASTLSLTWMNKEFSWWVYANYALLGVAIGMAQATLYIYLPELFPSKIRGRNVGICLNVGRVITAIVVLFAATLVPFMNGYANGIIFFSMAYIIGVGAAIKAKKKPLSIVTE